MARSWRLVGVAAALLLTSCGGGGGAAPTTSASPSPIAGRVVFWDTAASDLERTAIAALVAGFRVQYPSVAVDVVPVPAGSARDAFLAAVPAGSAPDVLRVPSDETTDLAQHGYLQPLDGTPLVADQADYLPQQWSTTRSVGRVWGVPQSADTTAWLCNAQALAAAGVSAPKSWSELQRDLPKFTAAGITGTYAAPDGVSALTYVYAQGGLPITDRTVTINDAAAVTGFGLARDLIASGAAKPPTVGDPLADQRASFAAGSVACILDTPQAIPGILAAPAFADPANLTISVPPAGAEGGRASVGGSNFVVAATSPNLAAVYTFVTFMNSVQSQVDLAESIGMLPTRSAAYGRVTSATPTGKRVQAFKPVVDAALPLPNLREWPTMTQSLDKGWREIAEGRATAQSGADAIAQSWLSILPKDYLD